MLQANEPDTYVFATNKTHSVRDLHDDGVQGCWNHHRMGRGRASPNAASVGTAAACWSKSPPSSIARRKSNP